MTTRWNAVSYENAMHHVVSDDLLAAVRDSIESMDPPGVLRDVTQIRSMGLEQGGMCNADRPIESFSFCDLEIWVPSEDLADLIPMWRDKPAVASMGRAFHRFVSWPWSCLVVDPGQRVALLDLLQSRVELAEQRAAQFWSGRPSPQEVLAQYNSARGIVLPYRPDKIDKFRS